MRGWPALLIGWEATAASDCTEERTALHYTESPLEPPTGSQTPQRNITTKRLRSNWKREPEPEPQQSLSRGDAISHSAEIAQFNGKLGKLRLAQSHYHFSPCYSNVQYYGLRIAPGG